MTILIALIAAAVAIAILAVVVFAIRGASSGDLAAQVDSSQGVLRPRVADFHVKGETATVFYEVPLPAGEVHDHLRELMIHDAARVVSEKSAAGLPIDQVERVRAMGLRNGEYAEIGILDLREPGVIPELAAPELVPHMQKAGYDPLAEIAEQEFAVPGIATTTDDEGLEPFDAAVELPVRVEASLRATGIDPDNIGLEDLTLGLLAMGGYTVTALAGGPARSARYLATSGGEQTLVEVVPHRAGEHPELSEQAIDEFVFRVAEQRPTRAMMVTDKFGPYAIYERERRDPRSRYITRERLQAFIDGFAMNE